MSVLEGFLLIGIIICFAVTFYSGRHILPQATKMMLRDIWKLKSARFLSVRIFQQKIQKNKPEENADNKSNPPNYIKDDILTDKNKDD